MKRNDSSSQRALLVADSAGHILERISETWQAHACDVNFELLLSERASVASCCSQGKQIGFIHWLDRHRAARAAAYALCPQAATIYHYLPGEEKVIKELSAQCDVITTGAKAWQEKLQRLTGKEVILTPQSIDTDWYMPELHQAELRKKEGVPENAFVIGFVAKAGANVQDRKGVQILCELLRQLRLPRQIGVLLVGPGWEDLAAEFRQAGIMVWQRNYPHCQETRAAYGLMDVLVVTAREEGGPATVMEAMSCGVPVVSSPVGHVPEMVRDGETGILCQIGDVASYLKALNLLSEQPKFGHLLAAAARKEMVTHWADNVVVPKIDFVSLQKCARLSYEQRTREELEQRHRRLRWLRWRDQAVALFRPRQQL